MKMINEIDTALTAPVSEATEEVAIMASSAEPSVSEIIETTVTESESVADENTSSSLPVVPTAVTLEAKKPFVVEKNFPGLNVSRLFGESEDEDFYW